MSDYKKYRESHLRAQKKYDAKNKEKRREYDKKRWQKKKQLENNWNELKKVIEEKIQNIKMNYSQINGSYFNMDYVIETYEDVLKQMQELENRKV